MLSAARGADERPVSVTSSKARVRELVTVLAVCAVELTAVVFSTGGEELVGSVLV